MNKFLPVCRADMQERGWDEVDFAYITGDAYVDLPSFGHAIISRVLEAAGYKIGIIAQPNWNNEKSVQIFGRPRLAFLVSGGNMDSMVNHYTVNKKHRRKDAYSPGGVSGLRPDRATIVYCNLLRRVYKDVPIIIGGIEASLRRLAHYDYWSDKIRRSILLDAQADLISYGMGERSIVEIADALNAGLDVHDITYINGTVCRVRDASQVYDAETLPSFTQICADKRAFAHSFYRQYINSDPIRGHRLIEPYNEHEFVVVNPPAVPLSQKEIDKVYELPYARAAHPSYSEQGGVPAEAEVKFSLSAQRGCFGGCNFCSLSFHQGRIIQSRSHASLLQEAKLMTTDPLFKGYIHDVGGPTANFRQPACAKQPVSGSCPDRQCLFPTPCKNLRADHHDYVRLLQELRSLPGIKKVFVRSGIRFDYVLADKDNTFLRELAEHHISGQLKVAPEHISDRVLQLMGKPGRDVYEKFLLRYYAINKQLGKNQYVEPYLMSSHPGSSLEDAIALAEYLHEHNISPEQVQDFYPTPGTISTCMYYTGLDPRTMQPVYVERDSKRKSMQRALIQYRRPENHQLVLTALRQAGRDDLIGFGPKCLIPPRLLAKDKSIERQKTQSAVKKSYTHGKKRTKR